MPKSTFDKDKDETLAEIGRIDTAKGQIVCSIMSYNGGASKVSLNRTYKKGEEDRFASLGRLAGDEVTGVIGLLEDALQYLQENGDAPEEK
jgi:hypothetical protein